MAASPAQSVTAVTARPRRGSGRSSERIAHDTRVRDGLWRAYRRNPDERSREALIVAYTPLVRYAANRMAKMLPAHVDADDLTSYGMMGLIGALDRYDPRTGVKFETFAMTRIRGAILDVLRELDWVPRSVRRQERAMDDTRRTLEQSLGRAPEPNELAEALGVSEEKLHEGIVLSQRGHTLSLEEARSSDDDASAMIERIADEAHTPEDLACVRAGQEELLDAIAALPERERRIITDYYFGEKTLREIGEEMDITESRVSQLNSRAVQRLRAHLEEAA